MRKSICALFLTVLCLTEYWLAAARNDEPNIYELEKTSKIKHQHSTNKNEHGKWSPVRQIIKLEFKLMQLLFKSLNAVNNIAHTIIPQCKGLDTNHSFSNGKLDDFKQQVQLITPGTKWCGPGNIARNESDIGVLANSDNCCKNHDLCSMGIPAGKTMYGLKNGGLFTRSSCVCDENFYNCLKKVGTKTARELGTTYFNVLGPQCFEEVDCSKPKVKCRNRQKKGTQFQWSDNPKF